MLSLGELALSHFVPYLGTAFSCQEDGAAGAVLVLESASSLLRSGGKVFGREPFSLVFTGPRDVCLAQGVYALQHPELGPLEIFLVPVGSDATSRRYEAIFS